MSQLALVYEFPRVQQDLPTPYDERPSQGHRLLASDTQQALLRENASSGQLVSLPSQQGKGHACASDVTTMLLPGIDRINNQQAVQESTVAQVPRPVVPNLDKMSFWAKVFARAMETFRDLNPVEPKGRLDSGFSIRSLTTWNDVYGKLREAQERYENHPKGVVGGFKRTIRKAADKAHVAQAIVSMVPEVEYVTPVLVVLKVLLKAAKSTASLRNELSSGLDELEHNFDDIETYIATFPEDENILKASITLLSSTLKAVEEVIGYYIKHQATRAISAVFSGDEYQQSLTGSLEQIKTSSQALLHQAQNSNMWRNKQTLDHAAEGSAKLTEVLSNQQASADTQNRILNLLEQYGKNLEDLRRENAYLAAYIVSLHSQPAATAHLLNGTLLLQQQRLVAREMLLGLLQIPENLHQTDMDHVTRTQVRLARSERQRAGQIVSQSAFIGWMTTTYSAELLIHGDLEGIQHVSALSLFCTFFMQALGTTLPPTMSYSAVTFFCGRHLDRDAPDAGGRGLIRSLVAQVLAQLALPSPGGQNGCVELGQEVDLALAGSGNIDQLCGIFLRLVRLLGRVGGPSATRTLFCVLDGIKYYERDEFVADMSRVVVFLTQMARANPWEELGGCIFKLLVTSPSPTRIVRGYFPPDRTFTMSHNRIQRSGQNFSGAVFKRQLDGQLHAAVSRRG